MSTHSVFYWWSFICICICIHRFISLTPTQIRSNRITTFLFFVLASFYLFVWRSTKSFLNVARVYFKIPISNKAKIEWLLRREVSKCNDKTQNRNVNTMCTINGGTCFKLNATHDVTCCMAKQRSLSCQMREIESKLRVTFNGARRSIVFPCTTVKAENYAMLRLWYWNINIWKIPIPCYSVRWFQVLFSHLIDLMQLFFVSMRLNNIIIIDSLFNSVIHQCSEFNSKTIAAF